MSRRPVAQGQNAIGSAAALRSLAKALERGRASSGEEPVEIQLLGQVTPASDWPKLLAYWERRNPRGTARWPRSLPQTAYALNLWPLPPGRVGRAAGMIGDVRTRQPKRLICSPGLTTFDPTTGGDAGTALAIACVAWIDDVAAAELAAIRLAPPILESWAAGGRLVSREVLDFDLDWSLPSADGV